MDKQSQKDSSYGNFLGLSRILLNGGLPLAHTWQGTRFLPVLAFLWAAHKGMAFIDLLI